MGKMNENQKVNAEIFGFIAEFIIGLNKVLPNVRTNFAAS